MRPLVLAASLLGLALPGSVAGARGNCVLQTRVDGFKPDPAPSGELRTVTLRIRLPKGSCCPGAPGDPREISLKLPAKVASRLRRGSRLPLSCGVAEVFGTQEMHHEEIWTYAPSL